MLLLKRTLITMVAVLVIGTVSAPAQSGSGTSKAKTVKGKSSKKGSSKHRSRKGAWKRQGQQKIDPTRARQIQEALIRENYLQGEPTGVWDARTEQALIRYQSDNGWQSKVTPDSRALIKLGLGPDHSQDTVVSSSGAVTAVTSPKR